MNDEDLLPENYQKHKKNMLDGIKKKYGLTDEEALAIVKKDELTEQALEISNGKYHTKVGIELPSKKVFENILHTN